MNEYTVVFETDAIRVLQFKLGVNGAVVTLVPQAGHGPEIGYDEREDRSLMQCSVINLPEGVGSYLVDFKGCTHARRNETYDDVIMQVHTALNAVRIISGEGIHLVGLCQGGNLAAIVAAVLGKEHGITELTIAGAPIDTTQAVGDLDEACKADISKYEWMVDWGITPFKMGRMAGEDMLMAWKSANPKAHYWDRYVKMWKGDFSGEHLYKWYDKTQDMAGPFYLHMIKSFFLESLLVKGEFIAFDKKVNLGDIKNCKVNIVTGESDTISPPAHTTILGNYVDDSCEVEFYQVKGGHLKVFNGKDGILGAWKTIFQNT